ncbi:hypothetical protein AEAC466_20990 [Asticcacaulis sp. AC466]|uniref:acylneuraminate cytidylyltransferase family protein n=1 Tax=Asticcacaulis sp. AC466 TaxID=1282362 RepID=UPI0003C3EA33|nr:hypothetical protein [Asticcacaulis sp. AC466]ESQ81556.1 hypothetical protein AEAC466_20990 [Asticcacaulis sp. AC466]
MKIFGYIPARLGSERLKQKNLKLLNGAPLVSYACEEMLKVENVDWFCLNTEAEEIAEVGRSKGIDVYKRDASLAESHVKTDDIVIDFVRQNPCDIVVLVNPTAPMLRHQTVAAFVEQFKSTSPSAMFSCSSIKRHALFKGQPLNFELGKKSPRTQDLEPVKIIDFVICAFDVKQALQNYDLHGSFLYRGQIDYFDIPEAEAIDIDTDIEFKIADILLKKKLSSEIQNFS